MPKTRKAMKVKQPAANESGENDDSADVYDVEKIIDNRESSSKGKEYYVKWKGYPSTSNTWEPADNILQSKLIVDYERRQAEKKEKDSVKKKKSPMKRSKKDRESPDEEIEDEEGEGGEEAGNEEEEDGNEEEEEAEEEPVKAKRPRTATKSTKKASVPRQKAQHKVKNVSEPEPEPEAPKIIKAKTSKRAEPKSKQGTDPKTKTVAPTKLKTGTVAHEPRKAPSRRNNPATRRLSRCFDPPKTKKINEDLQEDEEILDEEVDDNNPESIPTSEELKVADEDATVMEADEVDFADFKFTRCIHESVLTKGVTFQGSYKGADAVIRLEKTVFDEDAVKAAFMNKDTHSERDFVNDIYSNYRINPAGTSSLNNIKAVFICPADESVLAKYSYDESILFSETADIYLKVVHPYIDSVLKSKNDPNRWIYNILEGKTETDRVIMDDSDPDSGFMLIPDLKWGGDVKDLSFLAICHRRDLRSLRDLTDKHLVLLNNIMTKGTQAIKDKFPNFEGQLRSYVHYQPTFYHFHVHFKVVNANEYDCSDRDNLLGTIINNINLKKDYYKKTSLVYPLSQSHGLYHELVKAKRI